MYAMATPFYGRMRVARGVTTDPKMVERVGELGPEELATMAASSRPLILTASAASASWSSCGSWW